jgi:hypothetical protein
MIANLSPARRLLRLSSSNKLVLAEALVMLGGASVAIKLLPFRRTVELMGVSAHEKELTIEGQRRLIAQCRWAVRVWADRVPWRAVCFQRGLAMHLMLRRRGIRSVLHYGVAQSADEGLRAHVWVDVGERTVLGGDEAPRFTRLASFPAERD